MTDTKKKLFVQKAMGIALLVICAAMLALCAGAASPEEQDTTAVIMLAPLGLWMLFTRKIVIF